jgi:hypothetical protein
LEHFGQSSTFGLQKHVGFIGLSFHRSRGVS